MRAVTDLTVLGERTLIIDCDALQADGGTRTASITGAYVAMYQALQGLVNVGVFPKIPLRSAVAATSVGIVNGEMLLDLCYEEDSKAEVDMNVVMTAGGEFIEIQGTAERKPFTKEKMDKLLSLAQKGIEDLFAMQRKLVGEII